MRYLVALLLTGCLLDPVTPEPVPLIADNVEVVDSQYDPLALLIGPVRQVPPTRFALRTHVVKATGTPVHQVYVEIYYSGGWRFYERATDSHAQPLDFTEIKREVRSCTASGCYYRESVAVNLSDRALRKIAEGPEPFSFQLRGRQLGTEVIVEVPGEMVAAQLEALGRWLAARSP